MTETDSEPSIAEQLIADLNEAYTEMERQLEESFAELQRACRSNREELEAKIRQIDGQIDAMAARAKEIEAEAEAKARRTLALSEEQARERIERARKAIDELGLALDPGAEKATEPPAPEEAPAEATLEPVAEEPEPEEPEPPSGSPTTEELIEQLRGGAGGDGGDGERGGDGGAAGARLVAMNMALEGASREEVDRHLAEAYDVSDCETLIEDVFSRVGQ